MTDGGTLSCAEVQDLAAELGLGVLGGEERAEALAHLEHCPACRALVEDLAEVSDLLLQVAPEVTPPPGFDRRVLRRSRPGGLAPALRRRWPVVAGALAGVAAAVGVLVGVVLPGSPGFQVQQPAAVAALGGTSLWAAPLRQGGRQTGQVFVYAGRPSWVFMTVADAGHPGQVTCRLELAGGRRLSVGTFSLANGYGSWGSTVQVAPTAIRGVQLVDARGQVVAAASR